MDYTAENERLYNEVRARKISVEELIRFNESYLNKLAFKIYTPNSLKCDFDDVKSSVKLVFLEVVRDFILSNMPWDQKILTIVSNKAKREVYETYKNTGDRAYSTVLQNGNTASKTKVSLDALLTTDDDSHGNYVWSTSEKEALSESDTYNLDADYEQKIKFMLQKILVSDLLTDEEKFIISKRFDENCSWQEIADAIGTNHMYCQRHFKKAASKIRSVLNEYDDQISDYIRTF